MGSWKQLSTEHRAEGWNDKNNKDKGCRASKRRPVYRLEKVWTKRTNAMMLLWDRIDYLP